MRLASVLVLLASLALYGCSAPGLGQASPTSAATAAPAPAPAPAAVASPSPSSAMDLGEDPNDVFEELLNNLLDATDEAAAMSEASCTDLQAAVKANPNVFRSVQGFSATLKRAVNGDPDLAEDEELQAALAELDVALAELDGALSLCGISPS